MSTETTTDAPVATRPRVRIRTLVIGAVVLIVLIAATVVGYNYWRTATLYISSDDAFVDSNLTTVTAPGSGTLTVWRVKIGDRVRAGQALGLVKASAGTSTQASFEIAAPIDGTLVRVDAQEGNLVAPALPLAYMANLDQLRITAFIDETDIRAVRVGQPVDITIDAAGNTLFKGTVNEIVPATASQFALLPSTDRGTGNFTKVAQRIEVRITLNNPDGVPLFLGENASVRIHR